MLIFKAFGQNILTDALSKIFGKILRTIFLAFDSIIYALISYLYKIFTFLSQVRLFENDKMKDLANRMYIIVGVISLFLVAYALISAIINPDNATKGKNSSFSGIIKNIIFAIIGIALVPTIFSYAYEFQRRVLCDNVIARFFAVAPGTVSEGTDFSSEMAVTLFQSFYYVKATNGNDVEASSNIYESITSDDGDMNLNEAFNSVKEDKKSLFEALGNFDDAFDNGNLGYLYLISTVAGLYCAYVLLGFVIDIAVRAVKLSYLQVIAPLPIMTLVLPNQKKVFDNWLKKTTSCFLEVFVRVIAITFAAYAVRYLPEYVFSGEMQTCGEGITGVVLLLTKAAFIIGIFGFLKQAPKLIGELIPGFDSKGFKLGFKDSFAEVGGFRALGAAGGFASSAAKNAAISSSRAFQKAKQNYNQKPGIGRLLSGTLATVAGGAAGAVTGGFKGGYKGFSGAKDAKKWSDSKSAADKAAEEVIEERLTKDEWDDIHNDGKFMWSLRGHGKEALNKVKEFVSTDEAKYSHLKKSMDKISKVTDAKKALLDAAGNVVTKNEGSIVISDFEFKDSDGNVRTVSNNGESIDTLRKLAEHQAEVAKRTGSISDMKLAKSMEYQLDAAIKSARSKVISGEIGTYTGPDSKQHVDAEVYKAIRTLNSALTENQNEILNNLGYELGTVEYNAAVNAINNTLKYKITSDDPSQFINLGNIINDKKSGLSTFIDTSKKNVSAETNDLANKIQQKNDNGKK